MGPVNVPPRVYVDSQILIYTGELDPRYWGRLRNFWDEASAGRIDVLTSELSVLECLVRPVRLNELEVINAFESLFRRADLRMRPVDLQTLRRAARLRADVQSLRTPDAIHAAASLTAGAQHFLTNDAGFRRVPGLNVWYLEGDGPPVFT